VPRNIVHLQESIMKVSIRASVLLTAVAAVFVAGSAVGAETSAVLFHQEVSYSDLNLRSPAGTLALYRRIQAAAKSVCETRNTRDLAEIPRARACLERAVKEAVFTVNNSALTQHYLADVGLQTKLVAQVSR
jgi:UrcA family protein